MAEDKPGPGTHEPPPDKGRGADDKVDRFRHFNDLTVPPEVRKMWIQATPPRAEDLVDTVPPDRKDNSNATPQAQSAAPDESNEVDNEFKKLATGDREAATAMALRARKEPAPSDTQAEKARPERPALSSDAVASITRRAPRLHVLLGISAVLLLVFGILWTELANKAKSPEVRGTGNDVAAAEQEAPDVQALEQKQAVTGPALAKASAPIPLEPERARPSEAASRPAVAPRPRQAASSAAAALRGASVVSPDAPEKASNAGTSSATTASEPTSSAATSSAATSSAATSSAATSSAATSSAATSSAATSSATPREPLPKQRGLKKPWILRRD